MLHSHKAIWCGLIDHIIVNKHCKPSEDVWAAWGEKLSLQKSVKLGCSRCFTGYVPICAFVAHWGSSGIPSKINISRWRQSAWPSFIYRLGRFGQSEHNFGYLDLIRKTIKSTEVNEETLLREWKRLPDGLTLTVDTPRFVAVVWTVMNFVALFGAVDAGAVTTLELIRPTCQQGWGGSTKKTKQKNTNAHKVTPGNTFYFLRTRPSQCKVHTVSGTNGINNTCFSRVFQSAGNRSYTTLTCTGTGPGGNKRGGRCFIQCPWKIPHTLIHPVSWPLRNGAGQVYLTHSSF